MQAVTSGLIVRAGTGRFPPIWPHIKLRNDFMQSTVHTGLQALKSRLLKRLISSDAQLFRSILNSRLRNCLKRNCSRISKMAPRLTQEDRIERNRARCKRYYDTHQNEAHKRRAMNQIKSKGYFPRAIECVSTLELVECFTEYQSCHTPSEFALRKYRSLLASK